MSAEVDWGLVATLMGIAEKTQAYPKLSAITAEAHYALQEINDEIVQEQKDREEAAAEEARARAEREAVEAAEREEEEVDPVLPPTTNNGNVGRRV